MHIPQTHKISAEEAGHLLKKAQDIGLQIRYEETKHQLIFETNLDWLAKLYLPWTWEYSAELQKKYDSHYVLGLVKAGQASVGYFHEGILIDHKVFRAYMVRQKQGVSQIKHLKTKGKSRAGSRIRLAETERFFNEIKERMKSYSDKFPIDFWGISCSKTLWPFLFSTDTPSPFSKDNEKLIELPFHIHQGSFEEIKEAGEILQSFHLLVSEEGKTIFEKMPKKTSEDENW